MRVMQRSLLVSLPVRAREDPGPPHSRGSLRRRAVPTSPKGHRQRPELVRLPTLTRPHEPGIAQSVAGTARGDACQARVARCGRGEGQMRGDAWAETRFRSCARVSRGWCRGSLCPDTGSESVGDAAAPLLLAGLGRLASTRCIELSIFPARLWRLSSLAAPLHTRDVAGSSPAVPIFSRTQCGDSPWPRRVRLGPSHSRGAGSAEGCRPGRCRVHPLHVTYRPTRQRPVAGAHTLLRRAAGCSRPAPPCASRAAPANRAVATVEADATAAAGRPDRRRRRGSRRKVHKKPRTTTTSVSSTG
jgi:hypothetical protein